MKNKIIKILIPVILICTLFAGCSETFNSVDSLIRPPKLSGENRLLQKAFETSVADGKSIILKTPIQGNDRSSYLLCDIDHDGSNEAIVFYSNPVVDDYVNMSIFKYENSDWIFLSTVRGNGEEIIEVDFADINGDNVYELIISWANSNKIDASKDSIFGYTGDKVISIYSFNKETLDLIKSFPYSNMFPHDLNGNGSDELMFIDIDLSKDNRRTSVKIVSFDEQYNTINIPEINLSNIIEILNVSYDVIEKNNKKFTRVFVDGSVNDSAVITDIILLDCETMEITLPLAEINSSDSPLTIRNNKITCADINGDGFIEIPMQENLPSNMDNIEYDGNIIPVNLTVWKALNDLELVTIKKCIYNNYQSFLFEFPDEWIGKVSVLYNRSEEAFYFYKYDGIDNVALFSIKSFSDLKWNNDRAGYTKLSSSDTTVVGYKLYNNAFVKPDEIENYFEILN